MRFTANQMKRTGVMALGAVAIGLVVAFALQTRLGLLTTRGSSMHPHFQEGDLAITTTANRYEVGDIVAYRSRYGDNVVLHRIIEVDDGRYTFKGDNNDFTDPDTVSRRDILGKLWIRFAGAGFIADFTSRPGNAVALVGGLVLLLGSAGTANPRRRPDRRPGARPGRGRPAARPPGRPSGGPPRWIGTERGGLEPSLSAPAATLVGAVLLMGLAFTTPSTKPASAQRSVGQTVTYEYGATATPGVTYPDGEVTTGTAIFLQLVEDIRFDLAYALSAPDTAAVEGTYAVDVVVSGIGSWRRTLPVVRETEFQGSAFETSVELNPAELFALANSVASETGEGSSTLNLAIVPRVEAIGVLGGAPFSVDFDEPLQLRLDEVELAVTTKSEGDDLSTSATTKVKVPVERQREIGFAGRTIQVGTARTLTAVGFLAAAGWLAWSIAESRRQAARTAAQRLVHQYAASIVDVDRIMVDGMVIDVEDMASLARIAENSGRLILHEEVDGVDTFAIDDGGTTFRYCVGVSAAVPAAVPGPTATPDPAAWDVGTPPPYSATVLPPPYEPPTAPPPYVPEAAAETPPVPTPADAPASMAEALELTELTAEEAVAMGLAPAPVEPTTERDDEPGVTYF